jgi:dTMP kinase
MLIAFEGIDGSGKQTQARKLQNRLNNRFYKEWETTGAYKHWKGASLWSFPQYEKNELGGFIRKYLKGTYGNLYDNDPFLVSLLYALDRFQSREQMLHLRDNCQDILICDRYVASNMGHQGAKLIERPKELADLLRDIERTEFDILGLPKPDLVFLLDLTAEQSYERTHKRDEEGDIHQDNRPYLAAVRQIYRDLADTYRCWHVVDCFDAEGQPRSVDEIHEEIWGVVEAKLSPQ